MGKRKKKKRAAPPAGDSSGPAGSFPFNRKSIHLLIILSLGLLVYANTVDAPFQWDEVPLIENNPVIRDLGYFLNPSGAKEFAAYDALVRRYVSYLTFALNYRLHGLDVTGYHVFNITVHLLNALLVYFLVILVFQTPFLKGSSLEKQSGYMALVAALLFVAHPVQTEAVTYVFQRHASLAAFFYLLTLVSYARSRLGGNIVFYLISIVSAVLAMKTKENAFTLPFMVLLFEFAFLSGSLKRRVLRLVPLLLTLLIVPLSVVGIDRPAGEIVGGISRTAVEYADVSGKRAEYLFTQFRVVVTYIRLLFLPVNQNIDYDYPLFDSFFSAEVMLSFAFLLGVVCLGANLFYRSGPGRPEGRLLAFGIFWFFITLSVESSVIPIPMIITEYRVYLPSVGLFLAVVTAVFLLTAKLRAARPFNEKIFVSGIAVVLVVLSAAAYARNSVWRSEVSLWKDTVKKSPSKVRPRIHLGLAYDRAGRYREALGEYRSALAIEPDNDEVRYDIGVVYGKLGRENDAMEEYRAALEINPDNTNARNNLAVIYHGRGRDDMAVEEFRAALRFNPDNLMALNNLGVIYLEKGRYEEAVVALHSILRLTPDSAATHNKLGAAYLNSGKYEEAMKEFQAALDIDPENSMYTKNLSTAMSLLETDPERRGSN